MVILGIESSCDETAAAVVIDGRLVSNVVHSQIDLHAQYGGVVPEIAARSHIETIMPVIERSLREAFELKDESSKIKDLMSHVDAIAVTQGPGLSGSLLIGTLAAKVLAWQFQKPLYGVDHVLGHIFANFLETERTSTENSQDMPVKREKLKEKSQKTIDLKTDLLTTNYELPITTETKFPLLALVVSGGHSQVVLFEDYFTYRLLGQTRDDAVGEAFDKVAKMLGLPYPGGPAVEVLSKQGDPTRFKLPKVKGLEPYEFSFSGLKTAVLRALQAEIGQGYDFPSHELSGRLDEQSKADMAASFSAAVFTEIADTVQTAIDEFHPEQVIIGGGVAASQSLRGALSKNLSVRPTFIDRKLCTDNAAMIASLGYHSARMNVPPSDVLTMKINPSMSM